MKKIFAFVFAAALMASCGSSSGDNNLITDNSVGDLTFGMEKPALKGYKAELRSEYDEMDDYTLEYWEFKKGGEVAVVYWIDYRIDVYSPDFQTAEGLKAGMTLTEAQELLGKTSFDIQYYYDEPQGVRFMLNDNMAFIIAPEGMKGGVEAFNKWWASSRVTRLLARDFSPEAKIEMISIGQ